MPDAKWLLGCWEEHGRKKDIFGRPSETMVIDCIKAFPRGTRPIYVQHLLAMQGYHPRCSLQQMVGMVKGNKIGINENNHLYIVNGNLA